MNAGTTLFFVIAVAAAAQPAPTGSGAPAAASPTPSFRSSTKLVEIDVIVRDKNGPAAGLTQADFSILDNGKPQQIAVFTVQATSGKSAKPVVPLPPGVVSNRVNANGEPGAVSVVVMDQRSTPRTIQAYAIAEIVKFVEKRRAGDRIGIYTFTRDGLQAVQDITSDGELLAKAAKSLQPLTRPIKPAKTRDPHAR